MIIRVFAAAAAFLCAAGACASSLTGDGIGLKPCPSSPNCVSSRESDPARRVDPLPLHGSAAEGLAAVRWVIAALPRSRIVAAGPGFLRAEFRSPIFRFVDDVEFVVDESAGVVHVRSASRVGYSDLGVNRRRIAEIRNRLTQQQPPAADGNR